MVTNRNKNKIVFVTTNLLVINELNEKVTKMK
jgi:hypothetical protein